MQSRISWIDITKGLAIILVVIGHSIQSFGNDLHILFRVIYSFHMPVFFVLSGYTFKASTPFKEFLRKKAKSLLLPYFSFVLITSLYEILLSLLRGNLKTFFTDIKTSALNTIFITSNSYFLNLWFLPALFVGLVFIYFAFKISTKEIIRGGVCILASILSYLIKNYLNQCLPLCAEIGGFALIWLYLGSVLRRLNNANKERDNNKITCLVLSAVFLLLFNYIGEFLYQGSSDSYRQLDFPNVFLSILTGIMGTQMLISASKCINKNVLFEFLGRNSNIIYGLHFLLLGVIGQIIRRLPIYKNLQLPYVLLGSAINIGCLSLYIIIKEKLKKVMKYENSSYRSNEIK